MTTTAAQAAVLAAQAAADAAFFRSLDLSENNKENLPPWLLEEREPIWERQRATMAAWRPTPEQVRRYRARHPLPPERNAATHDISFSAASTLPIIRPRRARGEWHETFLQEWERPIIREPPPWISGAGRGNPVPQPYLNSPILDSRGNLIDHFQQATDDPPNARREQMATPRPEATFSATPGPSIRNPRRRAPIPLSLSNPQVSTARPTARNRPMSLMPVSREESVNEFSIFVDPGEREYSAEEDHGQEQDDEAELVETLASLSMFVDAPTDNQGEEAVENLVQTFSSIRIIVDEPESNQENEFIETLSQKPVITMAPTALTAIHRRPRSATYPGNKDQYIFAPLESIAETVPSPVNMGLPKPGPITDGPPGLVQNPSATVLTEDSTSSIVAPLIQDFEDFKKSFPRRVRVALELPIAGDRRVQSWIGQPSPPFEIENSFLEVVRG